MFNDTRKKAISIMYLKHYSHSKQFKIKSTHYSPT